MNKQSKNNIQPVWVEEWTKRINNIKNIRHREVCLNYWTEVPHTKYTYKQVKDMKRANVLTILHRNNVSIDDLIKWLESKTDKELIQMRKDQYKRFGINT